MAAGGIGGAHGCATGRLRVKYFASSEHCWNPPAVGSPSSAAEREMVSPSLFWCSIAIDRMLTSPWLHDILISPHRCCSSWWRLRTFTYIVALFSRTDSTCTSQPAAFDGDVDAQAQVCFGARNTAPVSKSSFAINQSCFKPVRCKSSLTPLANDHLT